MLFLLPLLLALFAEQCVGIELDLHPDYAKKMGFELFHSPTISPIGNRRILVKVREGLFRPVFLGIAQLDAPYLYVDESGKNIRSIGPKAIDEIIQKELANHAQKGDQTKVAIQDATFACILQTVNPKQVFEYCNEHLNQCLYFSIHQNDNDDDKVAMDCFRLKCHHSPGPSADPPKTAATTQLTIRQLKNKPRKNTECKRVEQGDIAKMEEGDSHKKCKLSEQ